MLPEYEAAVARRPPVLARSVLARAELLLEQIAQQTTHHRVMARNGRGHFSRKAISGSGIPESLPGKTRSTPTGKALGNLTGAPALVAWIPPALHPAGDSCRVLPHSSRPVAVPCQQRARARGHLVCRTWRAHLIHGSALVFLCCLRSGAMFLVAPLLAHDICTAHMRVWWGNSRGGSMRPSLDKSKPRQHDQHAAIK
jgi:hypothetical protein